MEKETFKLRIVEQMRMNSDLLLLLLTPMFANYPPKDKYYETPTYLHSELGLILNFKLLVMHINKPYYQVTFSDVDGDNLTDDEKRLLDISDENFYMIHHFEEIVWEGDALKLLVNKYRVYFTHDGYVNKTKLDKVWELKYDFTNNSLSDTNRQLNRRNYEVYYHDFVWTDVFEQVCNKHANECGINACRTRIFNFIKYANMVGNDYKTSTLMKFKEYFHAQSTAVNEGEGK